MAKFARTVLALLFALTAVAAWAAPVPKREAALALPEPLSDVVMKEWTAARGQFGGVRPGTFGPDDFERAGVKPSAGPGELPGFRFDRAPAFLPAPRDTGFAGGGGFGNFGGNQFGNLGGAFGIDGSSSVEFSDLRKPNRPFALAFVHSYFPPVNTGLQKFEHLHTIVASPTKESGLEWIAPITQLRGLRLRPASTELDLDTELKHLAGMTRLQALNLANSRVGDDGVRHVAALPELQWLDLGGTKVTDAGLKHLAALPNLSRLRLDGTRIGDAGLAHLARHTEMTHLDLSGTQITDAGLKHLAAFDALVELNLNECRVTADGLKRLACLPRLRKLDLYRTGATDRELEVLAACTELRALDLRGTNVTDAGLKPLRARPALVIDARPGW